MHSCSLHEGVCYIIDVAQAVPVGHRSADDLLAADCDAVTTHFLARGCTVLPYADLAALVRAGDGASAGSSTGAVRVIDWRCAAERRCAPGKWHAGRGGDFLPCVCVCGGGGGGAGV